MDLLNPDARFLVGISWASPASASVDFPLPGALLLGSIPGIILRSRLSIQVDSIYVRNAIAVTLALVGGKLLLSSRAGTNP